MHTFILIYTHSHCQLTLASTEPIGQDNQPRCPRPTPWPSGICGPRERGRRGKKKGGRASARSGFRKSVRDTQTRARETDSGRGRHRLSISCLWTLSAVCYHLSVSLFTYPLTSSTQAPSLCPCQFKSLCQDKNPEAIVTYEQSSKHEKWEQKLPTENRE